MFAALPVREASACRASYHAVACRAASARLVHAPRATPVCGRAAVCSMVPFVGGAHAPRRLVHAAWHVVVLVV